MYSVLASLVLGLQLSWLVHGQASSNCTGSDSIHLIAMRGHSFENDPDPSAWNVLIPFRDLVLSQIPGSDAVALPWNAADPNVVTGTLNGRALLTQYVRDYVKSCPTSYIAVLGFSEATIPLLDVFCGGSEPVLPPSIPISSAYAANVITILAWGDASRLPGVPWNNGSCPAGVSGVSPRVGSINCQPFASSIKNVCDEGDEWCCYADQTRNLAHDLYLVNYGQAGVDFIKARIAQQKGQTQSTPTWFSRLFRPSDSWW